MSNKMTCPACDAHTSSVWTAADRGEECPYCGHELERPLTEQEQEIAELQGTVDRVTALADQWNETPDYTPTSYDQGRVDQRHDMTMSLFIALERPHG